MRRHFSWIFLLPLLTSLAFASVAFAPFALAHDTIRRDFSRSPCYPQFERLMREWAPESSWKKLASDSKTRAYTSTVQGADSLEVFQVQQSLLNQTLTAFRERGNDRHQVTLNPQKNCAVEVEAAGNSSLHLPVTSPFTDRELATLIARKKPFYVYVWSPKMPFSKQGIPLAKQAAKDLGLDGMLALDPWLSDSERGTLSGTLASKALIANGALHHFPALMVYNADGEACAPFHGLDTVAGYTKWIKKCLGNAE
ncbi:MAG: hypothetical protein H7222_03065 [Methylotenera sp.]|nr:hypothetical protein [Oligoflexia bacterium]